jgi:hypothetical protein
LHNWLWCLFQDPPHVAGLPSFLRTFCILSVQWSVFQCLLRCYVFILQSYISYYYLPGIRQFFPPLSLFPVFRCPFLKYLGLAKIFQGFFFLSCYVLSLFLTTYLCTNVS